MFTDVAERRRAQYRIGERVQAHIGVGVPDQALRVRDAHAAQPDVIARTKAMNVKALAGAQRTSVGQQRFGDDKIFWRRQFEVHPLSGHCHHVQACALGD